MTAVKKYALLPLCGLTLFCARAQMPATNYDESQVPAYTLPDPLTTIAGKKVTDAETWTSERRPELLSLFESEVYGKAPTAPRDCISRSCPKTATRWATWPPAGRSPSTSPRTTHIS